MASRDGMEKAVRVCLKLCCSSVKVMNIESNIVTRCDCFFGFLFSRCTFKQETITVHLIHDIVCHLHARELTELFTVAVQ